MDDDDTDAALAHQQELEQREQEESRMKVYEKIAAVMAEMSKVGISKDSENKQQNYKFRGIDAVYGALSPLLSKHGLCILPRVLERSVSEQTTKSGGVLFYTTLKVEFDFVAAEDGSKHTVCMVGEAMDSGDKSSNKAMSAAYKYACFQAFCIPTEGDNDADATTHEVAPRTQRSYDTKIINKYSEAVMKAVGEDSVSTLKELLKEVRDCGEDYAIALWSSLPRQVKDYIQTHAKEAA